MPDALFAFSDFGSAGIEVTLPFAVFIVKAVIGGTVVVAIQAFDEVGFAFELAGGLLDRPVEIAPEIVAFAGDGDVFVVGLPATLRPVF